MFATIKVLIAIIIWGSMGIFVRFVDLPAKEIVFLRAVISGSLLLLIRLLFYKKKSYISKKNFTTLFLSGLSLGVNWLFLYKAYKYTTITIATLSYYMSPVFLIILAAIFLKEKITIRKVISILVASGGLLLVVSQNSVADIPNGNHVLGITFGLLSATQYATVILINKTIRNVESIDMTIIQILSSLIVLTPAVFYKNTLEISQSKDLLIILILGIVHTCIPYLLYFANVQKLSVDKIVVLSYFDPISAVFLSFLVLNEPLTPMHIAGTALVLLSSRITMKKKKASLASENV